MPLRVAQLVAQQRAVAVLNAEVTELRRQAAGLAACAPPPREGSKSKLRLSRRPYCRYMQRHLQTVLQIYATVLAGFATCNNTRRQAKPAVCVRTKGASREGGGGGIIIRRHPCMAKGAGE